MRLIGLDPGLQHTGWGVIEAEGSRLQGIAAGAIHSDPALSLADRLVQIHEGVAAVLGRYQPAEAAVEETFVNKNPAATLKLGMARGVVLLAPALAGLPVAEYPANLVKKAVVGAGHADKQQVAMMVRTLLPGCQANSADAYDALAVAICHAHHAGTRRSWARQVLAAETVASGGGAGAGARAAGAGVGAGAAGGEAETGKTATASSRRPSHRRKAP